MLNKAPNLQEYKSDTVFSKNERNKKIFRTGHLLMDASVEISPLSPELGRIMFELGNTILEEVDLTDDKMSEDEINAVINDILAIKG